MRHPLRLAVALVAAGTLAAGCGGNKSATVNTVNNSASMNGTGAMMPGNDASAMETMTPAPTTPSTTPPPATVTTNSAGTGEIGATPPITDTKSPPGGDTGGNSADKEVPGM